MLQAGGVVLGLVLMVVSVGMVYLARARDGEVRSFLQGPNGQSAFAMIVLLIFMSGGGFIVRALLS